VNKKQAEVDIATKERDMLSEKVAAVKKSVDDAVQTIESLSAERDEKVASHL